MKVPFNACDMFESIFYALLDSAENNSEWVDVDDNISVQMHPWEHGLLYVKDGGELFESRYVMCCEDDEEFTAEAALMLRDELVDWYESIPEPVQRIEDAHCWGQIVPFYEAMYECEDPRILSVYENCYWGHYYGDYGFRTLMNNEWNYGLPEEVAWELWLIAYWYCAEGCMVEEEVA